ncbi:MULTISPECIES: hypothetical protein [unclassified Nostoc]|nr:MULTISPECIES: hypothetical protein [unclassified Nostoc]
MAFFHLWQGIIRQNIWSIAVIRQYTYQNLRSLLVIKVLYEG